jgi:hypothetical protein
MPERGEFSPDDEVRAAQWEADRATEATPLPYADRKRYQDEGERQVDLATAERNNIARAAGALGMTVDEWTAKRKELGRSPQRRDV